MSWAVWLCTSDWLKTRMLLFASRKADVTASAISPRYPSVGPFGYTRHLPLRGVVGLAKGHITDMILTATPQSSWAGARGWLRPRSHNMLKAQQEDKHKDVPNAHIAIRYDTKLY